jgi:uncharacterized membrane protein
MKRIKVGKIVYENQMSFIVYLILLITETIKLLKKIFLQPLWIISINVFAVSYHEQEENRIFKNKGHCSPRVL